MSATVLRAIALRLEGPMQSYGASSVGVHRPTEDAPTKSALVGLVGAALGIDRSAVGALVALDRSLGTVVRVDRAGTIETDYHTAQGIPAMDGTGEKIALTRRSYLADAVFTVLLVNERDEVLRQWHEALRYPVYAPVLGRRACPPSVPLVEKECKVIEGDGWSALLDAVAVPDVHGRGAKGGQSDSAHDVYVDARLCSEQERATARTLVRRDRLVGPGPRMFYDRAVCVLPWRPKAAASAVEPRAGRGASDASDGEWPEGRDTTEFM